MRILIITLIHICFVQFLSAQHALFLPFNTKKSEVNTFIKSRDYLHQTTYSEHSIHVALSNENTIEYTFEGRRLSSISLTKYYDKRKVGREAVQAAVDYMGLQAEVFMPVLDNDKESSVYYSIADNKILELKIDRDGKYTRMQLTAMDRHIHAQVNNESFDWIEKLSR